MHEFVFEATKCKLSANVGTVQHSTGSKAEFDGGLYARHLHTIGQRYVNLCHSRLRSQEAREAHGRDAFCKLLVMACQQLRRSCDNT